MAQQHTLSKNNTAIFQENDFTCIQLHQTKVVKFNHKYIMLNTGGWETVTTKSRMNQASNEYGLGYRVYSKDFTWYVDHNGETHQFDSNTIWLNR